MVAQVRFVPGGESTFFDKLEICTDELITAGTTATAAIVIAQAAADDAQADATTAIADALAAQNDATTAIGDALSAQTDATAAGVLAAANAVLLAAGYKLVRGKYRFATQGGAVSSIPLDSDAGGDLNLPDNAIIIHTFIDVLTTPNSAADGASLSIGVVADEDVKATVVEASFAALMDGIQNNAMANAIKLTAVKVPYVKVTGEDLTSGDFDVYFGYILGN